MTLRVFDIEAASYVPHFLHSPHRNWTETNCWQDMMIEVLHCSGLDPLPACAFTLSTDFDGSQWSLFKFPPEDLRSLFGIEIEEIYVWKPVIEHLEDALSLGHLLTVEVDAWYLPDTAGVTYHSDHVKTGVVPQMLDRDRRVLGYFHNAGYFELEGDDFDGIFFLDRQRDPSILLPYIEIVKLERSRPPDEKDLVAMAVELTRDHLRRRPQTNPMPRMKRRIEADLAWLQAKGEDAFHPYAFATCRQCGATAEIAASFAEWLQSHGQDPTPTAVEGFSTIADTAKRMQFSLARVVRGRNVDLDGPFDEMEKAWDVAMDDLVARYGP